MDKSLQTRGTRLTCALSRVAFGSLSRARSQRDVVVLLPRVLELLVAQHGERAREALARCVRHDHLVDIAALGGDEWREEGILVFFRFFSDLWRIVDV